MERPYGTAPSRPGTRTVSSTRDTHTSSATFAGQTNQAGEYRGFFDTDGCDGYDLIEWIAEQPWCDGQVGLADQSWFSSN